MIRRGRIMDGQIKERVASRLTGRVTVCPFGPGGGFDHRAFAVVTYGQWEALIATGTVSG